MSMSNRIRKIIPEGAQSLGTFFESTLPLRATATLTLPHRVPLAKLEYSLGRWLGIVQAHERLTLGWIRSIEHQPQPHAHVVLVAMGQIDCAFAATAWRELTASRYGDAARVEPYEYGLGGLAYIMKAIPRPSEDVRFSDNITAFSPDSGHRFYGINAKERRHLRRVALQRA